MAQLFRKAALDRLSSPEQLDQVMRVTSPATWAALLACVVLIGTGLAWGVFGSIPTKVSGQGMLFERGALFNVVALGEGQIIDIYSDVDQTVDEGQVVARISQPDIQNEVEEARRTLEHLVQERTVVSRLGSEILTSRTRHIAQQRKSLQDSIRLSESLLADLKERVEQYEALLGRGLISKKNYLDAKAELGEVQQTILQFREQLAALPATGFQATSDQRKEQLDVESRIIHAEQKLASLRDRLEFASRVVSLKSGRVNEIFKAPGAYLGKGEAIMNLETEAHDDNFYVYAYFAPDQGKRIQQGMTMLIAPSVAKREEYGMLVGEVVNVAAFPSSPKGMMHILENETLVKMLTKDSPPIQVRARLVRDESSLNGFRWTSGQGAPLALQSGTLCQVEVVVEEQRPVSLVIPYLKKTMLGAGETN